MTTITMQSAKPKTNWLEKRLFWKITPAVLLLLALILISAFFHFYNIDAIGDANTYYTAAVESMLQSFHNFFFVAAEPGASVTVDKPPLGLWIEAVFAFVLGVSGFAVVLPNILSGLLSVPILYHLVRKYFGSGAGLVAAAVLVVTPVALAADRNNTMDGMLTLTLLLTAWCFILAAEKGKWYWIIMGGLLIGIGFNIKMMQVLLPVPAFYGFYLLAGRSGWFRKILLTGISLVLALVVSFSWVVIVDSIPAENRPYIGSSEDNTVMELIFGHNGLNRLLGHKGAKQQDDQPNLNPQADGPQNLPPQQATRQAILQQQQIGNLPPYLQQQDGQVRNPNLQNDGQVYPRANLPVQDEQQLSYQTAADGGVQGQQNKISEIGDPSAIRFYSISLGNELSWLLPLALGSLVLALFMSKLRLPVISAYHKGFMLWGGWLVTCLVFFSVAGFFHAYYLVMLAPALGAVIGMGWSAIREIARTKRYLADSLLLGLGIITLLSQMYLVNMYGVSLHWVIAITLLFCLIGVIKMLLKKFRLDGALHFSMLALLLIVPTAWTFWTISPANPNVNLPSAYEGKYENTAQQAAVDVVNQREQDLIDFLLENTQDVEYLVAVPNANMGAGLVLETGEPVLYIGGFTGGDPVVDAEDLAVMAANGELKYVLYGGNRNVRQDIMIWLHESCTVVDGFGRAAAGNLNAAAAQNSTLLFQCAE